ncbi:MAG: Imidazole glycerol phosphate synthase cyclase subunit [Candidatus Jettenia ecosi]|uniref:imidazole glycerol-phosphate synthase n=1 Tax=Candidatus Jettenia ecosi TaxID=2494326 RepID=A0A533Q8G9_9BACT|nr:MAG: Imidazole glycerol phosphate synthase cyclase subunit [Candidatus Jettenia ecosi]
MLKTRVIPCLLLKNRGLIKTIKFKDPKYVGDPINAVRIFNEKEVDELIFLDTTATLENRKPNFQFISEIASECFMPFGYGGGIRDVNDIKEIFNLGVEKIIINSYAVENPDFIRKASELYGSQSIVVSIDVKKNFFGKYEIYTQSGKKPTKLDPVEFAVKMQEFGAGEIFLNSIDRDGTLQGYDIELIKKVSESLSISVIASGGAGKIEDFVDAAKKGGASAVAAGSMFIFHGKYRAVLINYPSPGLIERILRDSFSI